MTFLEGTRWTIVFVLLPVVATSAPPQVTTSDEWRVIYQDDERIGSERTRYVHDGETTTITWDAWLDPKRRSRGVHLREEGAVTVDAVGVLKSFRQRSESAPGRSVEYIGTLEGDRLKLTTATPGRQTETEIAVPKTTRSARWFDWHQRERPMPPETRTRFTVFEPGLGTDARQLTIETGRWQKVRTPSGKRLTLLPMTTTRATQRGSTRSCLNEQGRIVLREFEHDGVRLKAELAPRAIALNDDSLQRFDLQLMKFIPSKRGLARDAVVRQATFEVTGPEVLLAQLQQTPALDAVTTSDGKLRVAVTAPELKPVRRSKRVHRSYLADSKLLNLNDPSLSHRARELGFAEDKRFQPEQQYDRGVIALKLQAGVDKLIRNRRFSIQTPVASQIVKNAHGDCTEHAVLLAAMLRVHRIPSRVVAGLRYSEGRPGFMAHMWTQAMLNGEWVTLDAMRGDKQPGAGYIHVAHSALSDDESPVDLMIALADLMSEISVEVLPDDDDSRSFGFRP